MAETRFLAETNHTLVHTMTITATDAQVEGSTGIYGVYVSALICQLLNWMVRCVGPPNSLRDDEWKWRNLLVSWLHALACVVWCLISVILYPHMFYDTQFFLNKCILFLVAFSTGYFLYDFIDIAINGRMLSMWEVELHHVAVGGMFYYNIYNTEWIPFNIIALLIEVNSLFLHSRKLLQMIGVPFTSWLYRMVIFLNISTFVIFRGIPLIAISVALTQWYSRVTLTYYLSLCASMFVMLVMNPILFLRLLRSDYLRKGTSKRNIKVLNGNNNHVGSVVHNKES